MFFKILEKLFEINVLTFSVRGDNCPISYKICQVLAIILHAPSCLFTMATGLYFKKYMYIIKHYINESQTTK